MGENEESEAIRIYLLYSSVSSIPYRTIRRSDCKRATRTVLRCISRENEFDELISGQANYRTGFSSSPPPRELHITH